MGVYGLLDDFPLLALFITTLAVILLSFEGGFRAGRWRSRRPETEPEVVVALRWDLDHPRRGSLRVSQQALIDLRGTMNDPPP